MQLVVVVGQETPGQVQQEVTVVLVVVELKVIQEDQALLAKEIQEALAWLNGLSLATRSAQAPEPVTAPPLPAGDSMRVYEVEEQNRLGAQCLGFLHFLESAGVLGAPMREVVIDRAMASNADLLSLDDLKIIVLMVYWSFGQEPDALILDELCDDPGHRIAH